MHLTSTFLPLLREFSGNFTQPTQILFAALMTGWLLSHRHRFVTELIQSSGSTHQGHHSRYHRFFSHAAWSLDAVFCTLARLLVRLFAPTGLIELAVDDTLCRKRGLSVYGTGMHYDPLLSSRALKVCSWGHDWVVLALIIHYCPWAPTKVWCLPLLCRLYRNRQGLTKGKKDKGKKSKGKKGKRPKRPADPNHRTRPELAREMIHLVAGWFPARQFVVSGDSAYGGHSVLRHVPSTVDLLSRVAANAALYAPAPVLAPGSKGQGRPRKKGPRLPGLAAWAADAGQPWQTLVFDQFGLHATLQVKTQQALYYKAGKDRLLTIVLVHDVLGQRPDQMFYCTRLDWDARQILSCYSRRWAIEVTFANCKQLLGLEDPANRLPQAVARTAPLALVLYSLVVAWYHQAGHAWVQFPDRPWYRRKREPSFADMLSTLRRRSWEDLFAGVLPGSAPCEKPLAQLITFVSRSG
jgi:DDE superfamily endonuclease